MHRQRQELSQAVDLVTNTDFLSTSPFLNKQPNWAETDLDNVDQNGSTDALKYFNLQNWSKSPLNQGNGAVVLSNSLLNAYRDDLTQQNPADANYIPGVNNNLDFINNMNNLGKFKNILSD